MTNIERMLQFPQEILKIDQWLLADPSGAPCRPINGQMIPVNPAVAGGMSFADAYIAAEEHDCLIGFYLSKNDPYCCIDLDVKDAESNPDQPSIWTTPEQYARFRAILQAFDSYTEISRHGKGIHIWIKASIGSGLKRDGVEIYSQERFIICTGNIMLNKPVVDRQEMALTMTSEMRNGEADTFQLIELDPVDEDWVIYERASTATNSDKFLGLYNGEWEAQRYPSQSEADLSLMSMFAFYTQSNEQCRRLFRMSKLGQREKANRSNYHVDRLLKIIRARQELEQKEQQANEQDARALVAMLNEQAQQKLPKYEPTGDEQPAEVLETSNDTLGRVANHTSDALRTTGELDWPPGIAGQLAQYIYGASMRPVKTISIITAIACLAGIAGKAYNIPKSGLNMYLVLIARSGLGKEAMHSGLSEVMVRLRNSIPGAQNFFDFTAYASGPALMKAVLQNNSFINVNSEWGRQLQRLAHDKFNGPMQQLRTTMTQLYQKSDAKSTVGGLGYSNKENNVSSATGVAYSMIGESTPDTFYEALTRDMMEDGFLSRFNLFEYAGQRPPLNESPITEMENNLYQSICGITTQAIGLISNYNVQMVTYGPEADTLLRAFDKECDDAINANTDEAIRQLWNRAHLKACRMAALLAVADNWFTPVVTREHALWALQAIKADMTIMFSRWQQGAIGMDDESRLRRVADFIVKYFSGDLARTSVYSFKLKDQGIIPRSDIQKRVYAYAAFRNHKAGANIALDSVLRSMMDMGMLVEVDRSKQAEVGFKGKAYYVTNVLFDYIQNSMKQETD